ncbi:hypothetical protein K7432_017185 [Basidiobolus ranarum]|uniref:Uncharacterized protein n=1 Tax=Basidiobolus ranarum TaxID=34480 RepID=A0ABR2WDQ1_9FUNG
MNKYDCTKSTGCPVPGHKCHTRRQLCFPDDRSECTNEKLEVIRLGGTYNMFCGVAKGLPGTINFAQDTKCEEWEVSANGLCYLPACNEQQTKCLRDEKECKALGFENSAELKCFWKTVPGGAGSPGSSGPAVSATAPSSSLTGGQIAGISIGSAVGVAIIAIGIFLFRKKRSNRNANTPPSYVENGNMTPIEEKRVVH